MSRIGVYRGFPKGTQALSGLLSWPVLSRAWLFDDLGITV